jgi:hypothetical protein
MPYDFGRKMRKYIGFDTKNYAFMRIGLIVLS